MPTLASAPFRTPFITEKSETISAASMELPGVPLQAVGDPVVVTSCSVHYTKPATDRNQNVYVYFDVLNRTSQRYSRVAIDDRFDFVSYQQAYIEDLAPHEYRQIVIPPRPPIKSPFVLAPRPASYFLCGAGPAYDQNGRLVNFLPGFFKH